MFATTEAQIPQSKLAATTAMTIAIVATAIPNRAACPRILAREPATLAAMPNGAEKLALLQLQLQLPAHLRLQPHLHPQRPLLQWIVFAMTEAQIPQSKDVVTIAMTTATVAAATRSQAA